MIEPGNDDLLKYPYKFTFGWKISCNEQCSIGYKYLAAVPYMFLIRSYCEIPVPYFTNFWPSLRLCVNFSLHVSVLFFGQFYGLNSFHNFILN